MSEILFRGKTPSDDEYIDCGEWVEGYYTRFNGKEHRIYSGYAETDCGDYYPDWQNVRPETVGQYTGRTDRNDKRIFEGDKPRNMEPKKEMEFWTPEEFTAFRSHAEDPMYRMFFTMLYVTGCRRGEAEALSWDDIDLERSTLKISKNITRKSPTAPWEITTPKNVSSNRTVPMPKSLCALLKEYKEQQSKLCPSPTFVFGGERPLTQRTTDRYFADVCEKAGVKKIRIHDLRHSCASLLISRGVSIVAVSRQLGHSNIEQTLNTYSHLMPDDKSKIIAELETVASAFK